MTPVKGRLGRELLLGASRVRTSLGTSHQVPLGLDDGDGVLLDRRGPSVAAQRDVAHDDLPHVHIMELSNQKNMASAFHQPHFTTENTQTIAKVEWRTDITQLWITTFTALRLQTALKKKKKGPRALCMNVFECSCTASYVAAVVRRTAW